VTTRNYYSVLGCHPNAEDIVIRGAYRALAQRYHPDKNASNPSVAAKRMAEINEAYATLSDPIKRKEYDKSQQGVSATVSGSYENEQANGNERGSDADEYFEKDWLLACSIYTSLKKTFNNLERISPVLADSYRIYMLETKQFDKRGKIAERMEAEFLTLYFGESPVLHDFARELILSGRRDVALALNQAVRVVGHSDPLSIIQRIEKDYEVIPDAERNNRKAAEEAAARSRIDAIERKKFWENFSYYSKRASLLIALLSIVGAATIYAHFWNTSLPTIQKMQLGMVGMPGKGYEIGQYEVTAAEWNAVMGNSTSYVASFFHGENKPVVEVSWNDIQTYLKHLNQTTGKKYRLPTKEEWEYACFGGVQAEYCGGDDVDAVAWYGGNSSNHAHSVGQKQPNAYGLYDMSGNVSEWLEDCVDFEYDGQGADCSWRATRGGGFSGGNELQRDPDFQSTKFAPGANKVESKFDTLGFRLARTLP